jgi:DNA-directed RNA polymerase subunit RPC12/RpoP
MTKWKCEKCGHVHGSNPSECKECGHFILQQHRGSSDSGSGSDRGTSVSDILWLIVMLVVGTIVIGVIVFGISSLPFF